MNFSMMLGFLTFLGAQFLTGTAGLGAQVLLASISNSNASNALTDLAATSLFQEKQYAYIVRIKLGNPPKTFTLLLDTGSSVTWVEHGLCLACINDDASTVTGYFESDSSTAEMLYCDKIKHCNMSTNAFCGRDSRRCQYSIRYFMTACEGFFFSDTLYMDTLDGTTDVMEGFIFGAALNIRGPFLPDTHGIFGLSKGNGSFVSQMGLKRLSFCLQSFESSQSSELLLGDEARMIGKSTPMVRDLLGKYVAILKGISVGEEYLEIEPSIFMGADGKGGAFLDTGARITVLPQKAYDIVINKLASIIKLPKLNVKSKFSLYNKLCFMGRAAERDEFVPSMMLHFETLNLPISSRSLFISTGDGFICLNMMPHEHRTIIGSPFMQNINIGIDLERNKIFMEPISCSTI